MLRKTKRLLLVASFMLGLAGCGLFQVPKEQIQSFSDAWVAVRKTHEVLLDQYEADKRWKDSQQKQQAAVKAKRFPAPLPKIMRPADSTEQVDDVGARREVVQVIDCYNEILLAIRDNRPITQTQQLTHRLAGLLSRGLGMIAANVGIPQPVVDGVVEQIRSAKTRAEIIRALRKAKISRKAFDLLLATGGNPKSDPAIQLAKLTNKEITCSPDTDAHCVSLITWALELMRDDATAIDAQRDLIVKRQHNQFVDHAISVGQALSDYLNARNPPTSADDVALLNQARQLFSDITSIQLTIQHQGAKPFDTEARKYLEMSVAALKGIDAEDRELGAGQTHFREGVALYRDRLLVDAKAYFLAIEDALNDSPDLLGVNNVDGDKIIPLAQGLINDSADVRFLAQRAITF